MDNPNDAGWLPKAGVPNKDFVSTIFGFNTKLPYFSDANEPSNEGQSRQVDVCGCGFAPGVVSVSVYVCCACVCASCACVHVCLQHECCSDHLVRACERVRAVVRECVLRVCERVCVCACVLISMCVCRR
jgi:hypothetical protein